MTVRTWIISRPSWLGEGIPSLLFEVLGFDKETNTIKVRGRFGRTFEMEQGYARKHYQPVKEIDDALAERIQIRLQTGDDPSFRRDDYGPSLGGGIV